MSLDAYSHVVIDPAADEWRAFAASALAQDRRIVATEDLGEAPSPWAVLLRHAGPWRTPRPTRPDERGGNGEMPQELQAREPSHENAKA